MWNILVTFTNGTQKPFSGNFNDVLHQIAEFCEANGLITEKYDEIPDETVYTPLTHTPLPEPSATKSVIGIHATVHEERGEWLDWWVECDDPAIFLPFDDAQVVEYLRKYDMILVGDRWFPGAEAEKAMEECYRQYRKITIEDDEGEIIAEIYDRTTLLDPTEDLGRYRWMSCSYGNVERTFEDVLEHAQDGETFQHNYKGW